MAEKVKKNFLILDETNKAIEKLGADTFRKPGEVIDWLVADAYDRILQAQRETTTVEQAEKEPAL